MTTLTSLQRSKTCSGNGKRQKFSYQLGAKPPPFLTRLAKGGTSIHQSSFHQSSLHHSPTPQLHLTHELVPTTSPIGPASFPYLGAVSLASPAPPPPASASSPIAINASVSVPPLPTLPPHLPPSPLLAIPSNVRANPTCNHPACNLLAQPSNVLANPSSNLLAHPSDVLAHPSSDLLAHPSDVLATPSSTMLGFSPSNELATPSSYPLATPSDVLATPPSTMLGFSPSNALTPLQPHPTGLSSLHYPSDRLDAHIHNAIMTYNHSTSWAAFIRTIRGQGDIHPNDPLGTKPRLQQPSPEGLTNPPTRALTSFEKTSLIQDLPNLRLSTLGLVNQDTIPLAPAEAMQFGRTLLPLLTKLHRANNLFGPMYMSKIDLADGFYRVQLKPEDTMKLGVLFPSRKGKPPLIGIPLTNPMGWKSSPPNFCAFPKTIADLANATLSTGLALLLL
eukprot:jgi/Psemu1/18770/gm1.18770_g